VIGRKKWCRIFAINVSKPRASAAFSFTTTDTDLLAFGANTEKFQLVRHPFETVCRRDARLDFTGKTLLNFHHPRTARADQMMVMPIIAFTNQFKSRGAVAEVKSLDHPHRFEQMHGAINRCQVTGTPVSAQGGQNFPIRERMRMLPESFQNGGTRAGDFSRLLAQTAGQCRKGLPLTRMRVGGCFHGAAKSCPQVEKQDQAGNGAEAAGEK
jgi:hypothetical protein